MTGVQYMEEDLFSVKYIGEYPVQGFISGYVKVPWRYKFSLEYLGEGSYIVTYMREGAYFIQL